MVRSKRESKLNVVGIFAFAIVGLIAWMTFGPTTNSSASNAGGMSLSTPTPEVAPRFGFRTLREGMTGDDVRILKGLVTSQSYLKHSTIDSDFDSPTTSAVKKFQKAADLKANGVVTTGTAKTMKRSMDKTEASWYGPGLYGNGVACGGTLKASTIGVANKTLPCGTKVMIAYHGRYLMTKVIDRGPYIKGRAWDLTYAAADALGFIDAGVANVRSTVIKPK